MDTEHFSIARLDGWMFGVHRSACACIITYLGPIEITWYSPFCYCETCGKRHCACEIE